MQSKLNTGNIFIVIGALCTVAGLLIFKESRLAQLSTLGFGLIISLFGYLLGKKEKKSK